MKKASNYNVSINNERVFHSNGGAAPKLPNEADMLSEVKDLSARLKKMSTTDDGKLQIVLEAEVVQQEVILKIRDLFLIQQGRVKVDFSADPSIDVA